MVICEHLYHLLPDSASSVKEGFGKNLSTEEGMAGWVVLSF